MKLKTICAVLLAGVLGPIAGTAQANSPDILPGLWEFKVTMKSESGTIETAISQAKALMAALPPEQKHLVEQTMQQSGIANLDLNNNIFQTCITAEELVNFKLPKARKECEQTFKMKTEGVYELSMACDNPRMMGKGEFKVLSKKSLSGKVDLEMDLNGSPDKMYLTQKGTWVKDKCEGP